MKLSYLNNKQWSEITREERVFCFELFDEIRKDSAPFLALIEKEYLSEIEVEVGVEVCFYRDVLHEFGEPKKDSKLPLKRTFDLAIFSANEIIIIEAKANQGFETEQLKSISKDKEHLANLFSKIGIKQEIKISTIAIYSSKYQPSDKTKGYFESCTTWNKLSKIYPNKKDSFNRADEVYETKK
ncbi:MAG: hypothetical protein ACJA1N_001599 [Saprospiraceae bacterium]|jgi:hypothetical protein